MNRSIKFTLAAAMAVAGACALVACGDDSSSSVTKKVSDVPEYSKLPKCELKNDAQKAVLDTSDVIYVCKDKNWEILDTNFVANDSAETLDDIPNCANKQEGNSYYIEESGVNYICENERWEIVIAKDDSKSSASTAKSSASTAKSSASKGKSSSSVIPGSDPESTGNKDGKSSASTAKSSASTAKSSASTAKSSASKGKSSSSVSKDNVKSSSSTAKSSATTINSNEVETFNDLPSCTENRAGLTYFVKKKNANYQCFYTDSKNRVWLEVETCGKSTIITETHFCADGESYEKCGTKNYDPAKEFCAAKEIYPLCSGKDYDVTLEECVSGSVENKAIVDTIMESEMGYFYFYTKGDSAYVETRLTGDAANPDKLLGGCYAMGVGVAKSMNSIKELVDSTNEEDIEEEKMIGFFHFFNGSTVEFNLDSCDYFSKVIVKNAFSETFKRKDYEDMILVYEISVTEGGEFGPYTAKEGDYKNCVGTKDTSTLTDIESQFCYNGVVYDRCGGSTFATSKVYDAADSSCVDGVVVLKVASAAACGTGTYDPETEYCFSGSKYAKSKYAECKAKDGAVTAMVATASEFCFEEQAYKKSEYEACKNSEGVVVATANITKEFCFEGQAYKTDDYEVCQRNHEGVVQVIAESSSTFCYDGQVYDINDYEPCRDENGVAKAYADRESEFCFKDKVYDKDKYVMCMNDKYEVTAVAEKGKTTCYEGEAYRNDVITACKDTEGKVDAECLKN